MGGSSQEIPPFPVPGRCPEVWQEWPHKLACL